MIELYTSKTSKTIRFSNNFNIWLISGKLLGMMSDGKIYGVTHFVFSICVSELETCLQKTMLCYCKITFLILKGTNVLT